MDYSEIIDISLPLSSDTIIYPGNPKIEIEQIKSEASKSTISKITSGSHNGTHIDAPRHIDDKGKTIDQLDLKSFIGKCRVLDCISENVSVSPETLKKHNIQPDERILLKTANSLRGFKEFDPDFIFLSPQGAQYLAESGVLIVGIDYLSIKQKGSRDNRPHSYLLDLNIPIIEGIDLSKVVPGEYTLVALPLSYVGIDGAPVRAVLLK